MFAVSHLLTHIPSSEYLKVTFAGGSLAGRSKKNHDRSIQLEHPRFNRVCGLSDGVCRSFVAVFGGHRGAQAAEFCVDTMGRELGRLLSEGWATMDALRKCVENTEDKMIGRVPSTVGASIVAAFVEGGQLYVFNVGDYRAVLSRCKQPLILSTLHRKSEKSERLRISKLKDGCTHKRRSIRSGSLLSSVLSSLKSSVRHLMQQSRDCPEECQVSRAVGLKLASKPWMSSLPDIKRVRSRPRRFSEKETSITSATFQPLVVSAVMSFLQIEISREDSFLILGSAGDTRTSGGFFVCLERIPRTRNGTRVGFWDVVNENQGVKKIEKIAASTYIKGLGEVGSCFLQNYAFI